MLPKDEGLVHGLKGVKPSDLDSDREHGFIPPRDRLMTAASVAEIMGGQ